MIRTEIKLTDMWMPTAWELQIISCYEGDFTLLGRGAVTVENSRTRILLGT